MSGKMGVTDIEVKIAEVMVRVALPDIPPEVAVMVTAPRARPVAKPVLFIVATDGFDEAQVTSVVISKVDPSE
jgi:hypothetical protein